MDLLLTVAVMYGLTFALKDAKLFVRIRVYLSRYTFFDSLFSCPYCVGFHSGWLTFLLMHAHTLTEMNRLRLLQLLVIYAFAGTSISGIVDHLSLWIERKATGV